MKKDAPKKHAAKDSAPIKISEPISVDRRSRTDRKDEGKAMRLAVPLDSHAEWQVPANRRDPIDLLIESGADRVQELLPIRYGRMMQSPFAFYRGAAAIMAADLAGLPSTGILVQACGDCHLVNFGSFATPERRQVIAINDFDETLPGTLGMGHQTPCRQLCGSWTIQWFFRQRSARGGANLRTLLPRTHARIRQDGGA
jgi:hypothetical protein